MQSVQAFQPSIPDEKELGSLNSYSLSDHIQTKIYELMSRTRQSCNLPELKADTYSEGIVSSALSAYSMSRDMLQEIVAKAGLACADFDYVENEVDAQLENTQPQFVNICIYRTYIGLAEQTFSANHDRIVGNPNITHIGLGIKREGSRCRLGVFISRRFAGVDMVLKTQDGLAVIMSGYTPEVKICCVKIVAGLQKDAILVGTNKIKHSTTTLKYVLMLSKVSVPAISMSTFKVRELQLFCSQDSRFIYGCGTDTSEIPGGAMLAHKQQVDYRNVEQTAVDFSVFNNYSADELTTVLTNKICKQSAGLDPLPENDSCISNHNGVITVDIGGPRKPPPRSIQNRFLNRTTTTSSSVRTRIGASRLESSSSVTKPMTSHTFPNTTTNLTMSTQKPPPSPFDRPMASPVPATTTHTFTPLMNRVSDASQMEISQRTPGLSTMCSGMGPTPAMQPQPDIMTPSWGTNTNNMVNNTPMQQPLQPTFQMPAPTMQQQPSFSNNAQMASQSAPSFNPPQLPMGMFQAPRPSILSNAPLFAPQQAQFSQPPPQYPAAFPQTTMPSFVPPQQPVFFSAPMSAENAVPPSLKPITTLEPNKPTGISLVEAKPVANEENKASISSAGIGDDGKRRRSILVRKAEGNCESMNYRAETEEFMLLNHAAKRVKDDDSEIYRIHKQKQDELKAKYLRDRQEVNQAFIELYKSTNTYDIICKVRNEQVECHKIVLIARSPFFRDLINKKELSQANMKRDIITVIMPEWYHITTFRMIVKFFYCSCIESGLPLAKYREILLMAYDLRAHYLERLMIVEYIIPNITKEVALDLVKDTYKRQLYTENRGVWKMLENICLNSVANNSYELIKNKLSNFLGLELPLLFKVIERSLFYLVEDDQLALLLKLAIDAGFAADVCDLLLKLTRNYVDCVYFDVQHLNIKYLIRLMPPGKDLEVHLMAEQDQSNAESEQLAAKIFAPQKKGEAERRNEIAASAKLDSEFAKALFEKQRPHNNRLSPEVDIRSGKVPTFHFSASLTEGTITDTTVFSPAFNSDSRSWHLKLDVTSKGDVSYFLVERGTPLIDETNRTKFIAFKDKIPLNFTTVLFEVVVKDPAFEKNSVVFFSFSHDQHQIIGHKNFFNIKQLSIKNTIELFVWIQEFPLHSAVIQHITERFDEIFSENPPFSINPTVSQKKTKTIYDIYASDLLYVLASDNLKCSTETDAFKCLQKYAALKEAKDIEKIDPLVDAIRFQYVDTSCLFTIARDHEILRKCPSFRKKFIAEIKRRSIPGSPSVEPPRKHYKADMMKPMVLTEDVWNWMLNSEHHSGYIERIERLKSKLEEQKKEEQRKEAQYMAHKRELLREIDRLTVAEKQLKVEVDKRRKGEKVDLSGDKMVTIEEKHTDYCVILQLTFFLVFISQLCHNIALLIQLISSRINLVLLQSSNPPLCSPLLPPGNPIFPNVPLLQFQFLAWVILPPVDKCFSRRSLKRTDALQLPLRLLLLLQVSYSDLCSITTSTILI
eukprot:TRINITY_DN4030_c0_g1_i1.p1 TRINITY_DN4030_c0_g1~~TRINITY_DN4030_c0_g1_i1.p1  ORF type:complete len:1531 (+),score=144.65 TRINITY_DN4030_c0_g1_i1:90-4595(+)